ncbi:hypothetical protein K2X30_03160 [bacterium]|nr:hypothetical protein [bacterium]
MKSISLPILILSLAIPATASAYTFDKDVPQATRDQITQDLAFLETFQGKQSTPFHQKVFGGKTIDGKAYVKFFTDRVSAVGMDDCGNPNAVACVITGIFSDSSKIWLTNNYIKFSHPQVAKMSVVFHEARHTEDANSNWPHANCPTPFLDAQGKDMVSIWTGARLEGQAACDKTPFGSYGMSVILLKNIEKNCDNCTAKVKMDAGLYGDDQFKRMTDKKAIADMTKDLYTVKKKNNQI